MKKNIIFLFGLLWLGSLNVSAQGKMGLDKKIDYLKTELSLTDSQGEQLKSVFESHQVELKELKSAGKSEEGRSKYQAMRKDLNQSVEKILDEKQFALYSEKFSQQNRKGNHKHMRAKMAQKRNKMKKGMRKEMHSEVSPLARTQRVILEDRLSKKDRKTIDGIRVEFKEIKETQKAELLAKKEKFKSGEKPSMEEMMKFKSEWEQQRKAITDSKQFSQIEKLVEKYDDDIMELMQPIKEQREALRAEHKTKFEDRKAEWKEKMKQRKGSTKAKEKCEGSDCKHGEAGKGQRKRGKKADAETQVKNQKIKFLLMDPNKKGASEALNIQTVRGSTISKLNVFPNPATETSTLQYQLDKSGEVQIEIWNESGVVVKRLPKQNQSAGANEVQINISELSDGSYFVVLKNSNGQMENKKLIISKR